MRVCQFRHFGTERSCAEHAGRQQLLVLQRHPLVSNARPSTAPARHFIEERPSYMTLPAQPKSIPEQQAKEIRRLSHDLSNALEIVLQTSFLLGTVELDDDAKKWRSMLDNGVQQAAEINKQLREYVRGNS
jgi:hypothetical protein